MKYLAKRYTNNHKTEPIKSNLCLYKKLNGWMNEWYEQLSKRKRMNEKMKRIEWMFGWLNTINDEYA